MLQIPPGSEFSGSCYISFGILSGRPSVGPYRRSIRRSNRSTKFCVKQDLRRHQCVQCSFSNDKASHIFGYHLEPTEPYCGKVHGHKVWAGKQGRVCDEELPVPAYSSSIGLSITNHPIPLSRTKRSEVAEGNIRVCRSTPADTALHTSEFSV